MFSKIFKKGEAPAKPAQPPLPAKPAKIAPDKSVWQHQLEQARGDDAALLAFAAKAPFADLKQTAVQLLSSEEALKQAEREFRNRDRRVHREAKQRLDLLARGREVRDAADKLIAAAESLIAEPLIPANRLVELDNAWQALDASLLSPNATAKYADLWSRLTAVTRERGEHQLAVRRWLTEATHELGRADKLNIDVAHGNAAPAELAAIRQSVNALLANVPEDASVHGTRNALTDAASLSMAVEARAHLLAELIDAPVSATDPVPTAVEAATPAAENAVVATDIPPTPPTPAATPAERWRALTVPANARVAEALEARFRQWQRGKSDARAAEASEQKREARQADRAAAKSRTETLSTAADALEKALGEGHPADATRHLSIIEDALKSARPDAKLAARIERLRADYARLKGWQQWGGGRARDDLVAEAEALGQAAANEKLNVRRHADAIDKLRERWKELDKLGGATSKSLWERFDAALKTAFVPVGAHLDKLKAQRQENLSARNALIAALHATPLPAAEDAAPDWRQVVRALDHFHTEWRKLGPVEHTVPRKAQFGLLDKMRAAIARLADPLEETRHAEQLMREKLIARAKALAANPQERDMVAKVRELQAEWQGRAKALPLSRGPENALWTEFKSATDAIFKQRDAAHAARDAEFKSNRDARQALIARLLDLNDDTPANEIRRAIADTDTAWRRAGETGRSDAAHLDSSYRNARENAQQLLAGSAKRAWRVVCDALDAKLALCVEAESANGGDFGERWAALPALPAVLDAALSARLAGAAPAGEANDVSDDSLLKLEAALDIDSPPAFQAARRDLKLRAMKNAIEGRQSAVVSNADVERLLAQALSMRGLDVPSSDRLRAILKALREKPLR